MEAIKIIACPYEEDTEIRLRMDYHHTSVKIQPTHKKGDSAEPVTTEIRYE